jgi:PadR family transcriptional regulator PadR
MTPSFIKGAPVGCNRTVAVSFTYAPPTLPTIMNFSCASLDGDNYGYEIVKTIYKKSDGMFELKEPSLYTSLKRLEGQKLIESYWGDESQGGRRKYYRITDAGKDVYQNSLSAWKTARSILDKLLERG